LACFFIDRANITKKNKNTKNINYFLYIYVIIYKALKIMAKAIKKKSLAVEEDVFLDLKTEHFSMIVESENPDVSMNDVIKTLVKNRRELKELKKQLVAGNK
jgi:hypothetical protein